MQHLYPSWYPMLQYYNNNVVHILVNNDVPFDVRLASDRCLLPPREDLKVALSVWERVG